MDDDFMSLCHFLSPVKTVLVQSTLPLKIYPSTYSQLLL